MMTQEQIKAALLDRNLSAVARGANVSYKTVLKIANGDGKRVSYMAVKALSDYLEAQPA